MRDLLDYILKGILDEPKVEVVEDSSGESTNLIVKAPKESIGLIIGKGGKIIRSIRNLVRVKATLEKKGLQINIEEI